MCLPRLEGRPCVRRHAKESDASAQQDLAARAKKLTKHVMQLRQQHVVRWMCCQCGNRRLILGLY